MTTKPKLGIVKITFNDQTKIIPIWLVLLVLGLIITVLPGVIATLMKIKGFSIAPGNTDAWISFWGSYLGGIFGMMGVVVTTFFIIQNQNILSENERKKNFELKNLEVILEWLFEIKYLMSTSSLKMLNTHLNIIYKAEQNHNVLSGEELNYHQQNLISVEEDIKKIEYLLNSLRSKFILIREEDRLEEFFIPTLNYGAFMSRYNYVFINKNTINPTGLENDIKVLVNKIDENSEGAKLALDNLIKEINFKIKDLHN